MNMWLHSLRSTSVRSELEFLPMCHIFFAIGGLPMGPCLSHTAQTLLNSPSVMEHHACSACLNQIESRRRPNTNTMIANGFFRGYGGCEVSSTPLCAESQDWFFTLGPLCWFHAMGCFSFNPGDPTVSFRSRVGRYQLNPNHKRKGLPLPSLHL